MTNVFTQDLVLSEHLICSDSSKYVTVYANRSTKLRSRHYHRPPLSMPIGDDLFELRHVGKLNTRVLYFFVKGRRIIAVHGIRSKATRIAARDRKAALDRKRDWLERFQA